MRRPRMAGFRLLFRFVTFALLAMAAPRWAPCQVPLETDLEAEGALPEDFEPLDLNRADEAQLLALPGMDPALARAILECRRRQGSYESVDDLLGCPGVPEARLAAWRAGLRVEAVTARRSIGAGVAWSERRPGSDTGTGSATDGWRRRDYRLAGQSGWFGGAARWHTDAVLRPAGAWSGGASDTAAAADASGARTLVLRARPLRALALTAGDFAPAEALGILVGVTRRAPPRGARGALVGDGALATWAPLRTEALDRAAPSPGGRFLRGGALRLGQRFVAATFELHPGETLLPTKAHPLPAPIQGLLLGLELGRSTRRISGAKSDPRLRGLVLAPRVLRLDGRHWLGGHLALPLAGGEAVLEVARDPLHRWRAGASLWRSAGRRAQLQFTALQGARNFVNPLGADAARGLLPGDSLSTARNDNHAEAALRLELRPRRGLATTFELRGGSDPATSRRGWDRSVGAGRLRVEAALGRGWSLRGDGGLESRGSPGPSAAADAPLRRATTDLEAAWQRGRAHFRCGVTMRVDLAAPPGAGNGAASPSLTGSSATLVEVRGRWPLASDVWIGGGVSHFHLPSGALLSAYEERPVDLNPGVTLRGHGQRAHVAISVDLPFGVWGLFGAQERRDGILNTFWGSALRLRLEERRRAGSN